VIPRAEVVISLDALRHNFQRVQAYVPHSKILAMIKSNAYGHGLLRAARALLQADAFGVANLDEAIQLRQAGIKQTIILMPGFIDQEELQLIADYEITPVIHQLYQITILETISLAKPIAVWLKIDSGMHRLGLLPNEVPSAYQRLQACPSVRKPLVFMTHLYDADNMQANHVQQQLEIFIQATHGLIGEKCIANSAGIVHWPQTHSDWVRPGIMLYGISPMLGKSASDFDLQPAMAVHSRIMAVHNFRKNDAIGYGSTWSCPEDMRVGVINFGYGNGYPRHARNGTPLLVNGVECALIGRVSMDLITVDLRNYPQANIGDLVTLWGKGLPVERVAASADTIAYELVCAAGKLLVR
jgi:alanine racemase